MTDKEMQDVKVRLITGLYSRGDVSMVFAEIERLQAENRRLKKSVDNQCDDCACEIANERDRLKAENDELFYKLSGVMLSVDKWLDGEELNQDEVNRACTMREKTLQITERLTVERDKAVEDLRRCRRNKCDYCYYSNKNKNTPCRDCQSPISNCGDRWKWRGLE